MKRRDFVETCLAIPFLGLGTITKTLAIEQVATYGISTKFAEQYSKSLHSLCRQRTSNLIDPTKDYVKAMTKQYRKTIDELIISCF